MNGSQLLPTCFEFQKKNYNLFYSDFHQEFQSEFSFVHSGMNYANCVHSGMNYVNCDNCILVCSGLFPSDSSGSWIYIYIYI